MSNFNIYLFICIVKENISFIYYFLLFKIRKMYETEATGLASPWRVTREIANTIFKFPLSFMICALH